MRKGRRVGVDIGAVRIGVAACDPDGLIATPVETVPADDAALERIAHIVTEQQAIEVVVGLPVSLSGREGPAATEARAYAVRLADRVHPVPVRLVDERLTTASAERALRTSGRKGRSRRAVVDQAAAVEILQSALDAERTRGAPSGEILKGSRS
ncbi:MAG TPA: Holliday junction resolvase RuvX [Nocardioidaceae bacterium]|nr:Holliday junction resolvase RuvX [Nocardioidaceae bacterium]